MLQPLAADLWQLDNDVYLPGGFHFPGRMVVVRTADGGLVLISPVPIDDALAAELAALGPVAHIVAPCLFHHLFLAAAAARYPDAVVWAPAGLADKVQAPAHRLLGRTQPWPGELDTVTIDGIPMLQETVFLHRRSGTLIVTDLVFNLHRYDNWRTGFLLWLVGARRRLAQSRSVRLMTRDRAAAAASARQVLALDFDRLVMAHGDIIETGGKERLAQALAWLLAAPALPDHAAPSPGSAAGTG